MGERERERGMEGGKEVRGGRRERGRLGRVAFPSSTMETHFVTVMVFVILQFGWHIVSQKPQRDNSGIVGLCSTGVTLKLVSA